MNELQLVIENTFISGSKNNKELGINVFDRVFSNLVKQDLHLGKIQPIYLEFNTRTVILGIITLNKSGSYSYFPELPGEPDFDHMTFSKTLTSNKHHYTRVHDKGREKILPINIENLSNGLYHAATFAFGDLSLLKEAPKIIIYPIVDTKKSREIENAFFTSGKPEGSTILKINEENIEACFLQLFLIPRAVNYKNIQQPFIQTIKKFDPELDQSNIQNIYCSVIPHECNDDYSLGITIFSYKKRIKKPLIIATAANKNGFYKKIDIKFIG